MPYKPQISPKLRELWTKGEKEEWVKLLLSDGRRVTCRFDCLTYANTSDDDDTDIMVASVDYNDEYGELLAEEDIEKVL